MEEKINFKRDSSSNKGLLVVAGIVIIIILIAGGIFMVKMNKNYSQPPSQEGSDATDILEPNPINEENEGVEEPLDPADDTNENGIPDYDEDPNVENFNADGILEPNPVNE